MMLQWEFLVPVIVSVLALIGTLYGRRADSASKLTGSAMELVQQLEYRLDLANAKITALEKGQAAQEITIQGLRERVRILEQENHELRVENNKLRKEVEVE